MKSLRQKIVIGGSGGGQDIYIYTPVSPINGDHDNTSPRAPWDWYSKSHLITPQSDWSANSKT